MDGARPLGRCPRQRLRALRERGYATDPLRAPDAVLVLRLPPVLQRAYRDRLACSALPLRKWVIAIYLEMASPKGIASTALGRAIGVRQGTAWFMLHRIREAFPDGPAEPFVGPVEVDETSMGGKERNKHADKKLHAGRGTVGKTIVVGARDRATGRVYALVAPNAARPAIQRLHPRQPPGPPCTPTSRAPTAACPSPTRR